MFKSVKNKKIFEEILDQIKELLITKKLVLGQKIPSEIELSETLGISRSSLREALRVLDVLGIIEAKAGEGTVIRQANPANLKNIMSLVAVSKGLDRDELSEVRTFLEIQAAGLAAVRRSEADLKEIKQHFLRMNGEYSNQEMLAELDHYFHHAIVKASQNRMLVMLMELISGLLSEMIKSTRSQLAASPEVLQEFQQQHWQLYKAIESRDPIKAESVMFEHLIYAKNKLALLPKEAVSE